MCSAICSSGWTRKNSSLRGVLATLIATSPRPLDAVLSRCVLEFDGAVSGRDQGTGSGRQVNRLVSKVLV
jgi:hypothetical protein